MQIAEQLFPNGMTGASEFNNMLRDLVADNKITRVIETGTFYGTGTTRAILEGLWVSGVPFQFYSIEVNPLHHRKAQSNLGKVEGLHLLNGLSVDNSQKPSDATFDGPDFVVIDHYPESRAALYEKEVNFNVPDNQLDVALKAMDYKPHLVVLDSVGNMGMIEFLYVMERVSTPFLLALDDTDHYKHFGTMELIRANPSRFTIQWEVRASHVDPASGSKFGSALILVS